MTVEMFEVGGCVRDALMGRESKDVDFVVLAPSIVAGTITLGLMNQILNALGQVRSSFQYLVSSWTTVVELLSIYKRLRAFESVIHDEPLPAIDRAYLENANPGGS